MANGHEFSPENLHREGCTFGQLLANDVSHMKEDLSEIKADMKDVKGMVTSLKDTTTQHQVYRGWGDKVASIIVSAVVAGAVGFFSRR
jgi:hypothetical protein